MLPTFCSRLFGLRPVEGEAGVRATFSYCGYRDVGPLRTGAVTIKSNRCADPVEQPGRFRTEERGLAILQPFNANSLYAARNRLQNAVYI
jgi:hypothetical protein